MMRTNQKKEVCNMPNGILPHKSKGVTLNLTKANHRQLGYIAEHYNMSKKDVIPALLRREALKISKKEDA
jgi:hypothetical protein